MDTKEKLEIIPVSQYISEQEFMLKRLEITHSTHNPGLVKNLQHY